MLIGECIAIFTVLVNFNVTTLLGSMSYRYKNILIELSLYMSNLNAHPEPVSYHLYGMAPTVAIEMIVGLFLQISPPWCYIRDCPLRRL